MDKYIRISDLVNQKTGKTFKQENLERQHTIPIGTLVEIISCDGVRLYVVNHGRDCDGTPLYYLCHDKNDTLQTREGFKNPNWIGGFSEVTLKAIKEET